MIFVSFTRFPAFPFPFAHPPRVRIGAVVTSGVALAASAHRG
jgi:hypothetical protein